jgi:hypothetical protein
MPEQKPMIIAVTPFRRRARTMEREIQHALDTHQPTSLPDWVHGVRVEKAGLLQWAVVATENRGH